MDKQQNDEFAAAVEAANASHEALLEANAAAAREEVERAEPIVCLGRKGGQNVYYSRSNRGIFYLTPERHTRLPLLHMAPLKAYAGWLLPDVAPEELSNRAEKNLLELAARRLLEDTADKRFKADSVRAAGIWRESGENALIYNNGRFCYHCAEGAEPRKVDSLRMPWVYDAGEELPEPAAPLTDEQGQALIELLSARSWAFPYTGELLSGWIVNALLCGVMAFRGHIWINAPRNSGKTALRDELLSILGCYFHPADSTRSTSAGIYRGVKNRLLPIICDEQETEEKNKRTVVNVESKLEIARMASNASPIELTGKNGETETYFMRQCFLFFSVDNSLARETDITRWGVFRLMKCDKTPLDAILASQHNARKKLPPKAGLAGALVGRVLRYGLSLLRNIPPLVDALREAGAEPRRAEMFAGWLAGAHLLTKGGDMTADDIAHAVKVTQAYAKTEESRSDFLNCIDELRAYPIQIQGMRRSLANLCLEYDSIGDGESRDAILKALNGVGVIAFSLADFLKLDGSPSYLRKLFSGTEFEKRAKSVLTEGCKGAEANIYGCKLSSARYPHAGTPVKAIFIPAHWIESGDAASEDE